jgi:RNA polymerase primary sigma factor
VSLDGLVGENTELGDLLADPHAESPADVTTRRELAGQVKAALTGLSARQAEVVRLRCGFDEGGGLTLEEIGKRFGVTRERARQIEQEALGGLRQPFRTVLAESA